MSIEILTVDLSEATIDAIADAVAARLSSGSVGNSSPAPHRTQRAEDSAEGADPWAEPGNYAEDARIAADVAGPSGSRTARDASLARPTGGRAAQPAARPTTGSRAGSDGGTKTVKTKNGVQTWRFPSDAPDCDCGQPAGLVGGTAQSGRRWKAYKCAKRSGDEWRNACEFNEWA